MAPAGKLRFDEISYWSEVKLDIVKEYATAYSTILARQRDPSLHHVYIDAFAGAGIHVAKATGEFVQGSPLNALAVEPPFRHHHLIDLDHAKVKHLRELTADRGDVTVHEGNTNVLLLETIFPQVRYEDYRRGLCLLDPYGLTLDWSVIAEAGRMRTIDMFLNFPIMDMNRNAMWRQPEGIDQDDLARMTAFWGDESWRDVAYEKQGNLFGPEDLVKKPGNEPIVTAFRKRLRQVAGFKHVPLPMPMRISTGGIVYYLFFASQNDTANKIVREIFDKHGARAAGR